MKHPLVQPADIAKIVIEQSNRAHVGHIGSALSVTDIVAALYGGVMNIDRPEDPDRDRFVLSKGHAVLALYAALFLRGWLTQADLETFCTDGSLLGVHPEHRLRGIDFSTGSLGQGLSFGVGAALAARLQGSQRVVYVLVSDAECNEGSIWEAAMFAAHHRLSNLVAIVDVNGQQALGHTAHVLDLSPLSKRWESFGWTAHEVDGHDPAEISRVIGGLDRSAGAPHVLLARTIFGKGVSYMEGRIKWHYWPMSEQEFLQAMSELGSAT